MQFTLLFAFKKTKYVISHSVAFAILFAILFLGFFSIKQAHAQNTVTNFPRALLYVTNSKKSITSLEAHVSSSDIIAPQTYAATPKGKLLGSPNSEILRISKDSGAKIMPLVVNQNFSGAGVNTFLQSDVAQTNLINSLITEAQKNGYIGYQYDFEHIPSFDKDLYSVFVAKSAPLFHQAGLQLSVAVAPRHSDNPADYGVGSWQSWTGAFDYKAIGYSADFVSVMAYDDSRSIGPVASMPFLQDVINYTLDRIPANKVSMGIPFYAWIWNKNGTRRESVTGYSTVSKVLDSKKYIEQGFSDELGVSYVTYKKKGHIYTAWYEDQKSLQQKLSLIVSKKINGFSAWAMGLEDPNIWNSIVTMRASVDGLALRP